MSDRFQRAFELLAVHEGGYVDHPADPGGATNRGVTQRVYNAWRSRRGLAPRSVRLIADDEVQAIYHSQYWQAIRADQMPEGVGYCVFDAAVNSGPAPAVRWAQEIIGAAVDGIVGEETLTLLGNQNPQGFIDAYCDRRLAFMRSLSHWRHFGKGWSRRVSSVRETAKDWSALGAPVPAADVPAGEPTPPARGPQKVSKTLQDVATDPRTLGPLSGLGGALVTASRDATPIQWGIAAALVVLAAVAAVWIVKEMRQ